ncbi:hypothetical protein C0Q70_19609 [Pomacea canaliculata]|uniref:Glutathione synthetase n=2 Tax=Pomacea canaliculata TaxID=400727 RepID=A0A2T7NJV6_POMCA|nr:hypothetical protein C0Q70_19609 [Pomacea canaliculata]
MVFKPNTGQDGDLQATCVPFTLFPSVVPYSVLEQAYHCQTDFNTLMYLVAQDDLFLEQSLRSVIKVDAFVRGLWDIYKKVREEGITQPVSLDLFRNDFMINMATERPIEKGLIPSLSSLQLKQIEFNTISASFAGLIGATSRLHKYTLNLARKSYASKQMPDNDPAYGMAVGLVKAWEIYAKPSAVILFLVSSVETNSIDQRHLEFKVHDLNPSIRVIRRTFLDIYSRAELTKDMTLVIDNTEVAIVYFRTGYSDESYPSDKEWKARLLMERSRAIKCPTVQSQLSGFKKVQQELARPGAVERFISDPAAVNRIRSTFAGLYTLDMGPEGDESVRLAITSPSQYVLKPQREGGGHNIYGNEIKILLEKIGSSSEREAYILMERIFPLTEKNYLIKSGVPFTLSDVVSELGIYGVYIGDGGKEVINTHCGHMLRTKLQGINEGGIVAGFAALDTPFVADA